jgi:hypothetical protein
MGQSYIMGYSPIFCSLYIYEDLCIHILRSRCLILAATKDDSNAPWAYTRQPP